LENVAEKLLEISKENENSPFLLLCPEPKCELLISSKRLEKKLKLNLKKTFFHLSTEDGWSIRLFVYQLNKISTV
jgi:hypothetical protein